MMKKDFFNLNRFGLMFIAMALFSSHAFAQTDSVEDLINGHFSGVQVLSDDGAPGSAISVRIRGQRSFRGDSQPLYVLDGVLLNSPLSDLDKTFWSDDQDYQALQNTLDNINPEDIAEIKILKDASALALYGSMGANGVVLITTKKGNANGIRTNWNSTVSVNQAARVSHKHHVSVSGGNSKNLYYVSAGYRKTNGTLKRSSLELATVDARFEQKFGQTSKFGAMLTMGMRNNSMVMATSPLGSNSSTKSLWSVSPNPKEGNDVWTAAYDDDSRQYSVIPNLYLDAALGAGFRFKLNAGFDLRNKTRMRWAGSDLQRAAALEGLAGQASGNSINYNADASFAYNFSQDNSNLDINFGTQFTGQVFNEYILEGYKFFSQDLRAKGISIAENVAPYRHVENNNWNVSIFANLEYNYGKRYYIGGTVRTEMQNKFDKSIDGRTTYPAIHIGWDIANEAFMADQKVVNTLKITAGAGKSGAKQILPYGYDLNYASGIAPAFYEEGLTNYYEMRWTNLVTQYNVGLDLGMLDNRIVANINAYYSKAKDNLSYYYHTPGQPYTNVYSNKAEVLNKGIEFSVSADIIRSGDFTWNLAANYAYNHNEILSTGSIEAAMGHSVGKWDGKEIIPNANLTGSSVGAFYGYKSQGTVKAEHTLLTPAFFGTRLKEGDVKFIDVDGDGNVTEADQTIIGNSLPKHLVAFNTKFTWRTLSLYAAFDGAMGHQVANLRKFYSDSNVDLSKAVGVNVFSNRILEDASYLRLSELTLAYRINLEKVKWMDSIGLSLSAKNLCTFTKYSGTPYVNSYGFDLSRAGIDNGAYPSYRSFLLGINLRF